MRPTPGMANSFGLCLESLNKSTLAESVVTPFINSGVLSNNGAKQHRASIFEDFGFWAYQEGVRPLALIDISLLPNICTGSAAREGERQPLT